MTLSFSNPRDPENLALRGKIEEWLRECGLLAGHERLQSVSEESDRCGPNCPHTETLLRVGSGEGDEFRELRIPKPLVFVRRNDVRALAV